MSKWFIEVVQDFDGSYYANMTIDAMPVKGLPEYVDYNTLRNAIKEKTGIEILKKKDMLFQQCGRKKYAYIDCTQQREDCRVTLDEFNYTDYEPNFDSVWITVYKDVLGFQDNKDNLTEILVPKQWLVNALKVIEGVEDYKSWCSAYTADNTITLAQLALRKGVIQACADQNILLNEEVIVQKEENTLEALKDIVVLTCTHESRFGADSFVSFHSSEDEANKHVNEVAEEAMYDESRDDERFQIDIQHFDFSKFPTVVSLEQKKNVQIENITSNVSLYEKAANMVDDLLSERDGDDLFYIANVYYTLSFHESEQNISREELLKLTEKIVDASYISVVPILTAERVDAVKAMLEFGITAKRSDALPELTPEQAKKVLLNCELEDFCTIVDQLSVDNHHFYEPDKDDITGADIDKVKKAVAEILHEPIALEDAISVAEAHKGEQAAGNTVVRDFDRDF